MEIQRKSALENNLSLLISLKLIKVIEFDKILNFINISMQILHIL